MAIRYADLIYGLDQAPDVPASWSNWATYYVNQKVSHLYNAAVTVFRCTANHAASNSTEPSTGETWAAYWEVNPIRAVADGSAVAPLPWLKVQLQT